MGRRVNRVAERSLDFSRRNISSTATLAQVTPASAAASRSDPNQVYFSGTSTPRHSVDRFFRPERRSRHRRRTDADRRRHRVRLQGPRAIEAPELYLGAGPALDVLMFDDGGDNDAGADPLQHAGRRGNAEGTVLRIQIRRDRFADLEYESAAPGDNNARGSTRNTDGRAEGFLCFCVSVIPCRLLFVARD